MLIHTAADARCFARNGPKLVRCPAAFKGTLAEFATRYVLPNVPAADVVADFHRALVEYVKNHDALFLLRQVRGTERRRDYRTRHGVTFRATDNAPAWWVHAALARGYRISPSAMRDVVSTMPCHRNDVRRVSAPTASEARWHIAHLFDVKNRDTNWAEWSHREVVARFVRNIHPANYFLLSLTDWPRWGADARVIGSFAALYRDRYAGIWEEFVALSGGDAGSLLPAADVDYAYGAEVVRTTKPIPRAPSGTSGARTLDVPAQPRGGVEHVDGVVQYRTSTRRSVMASPALPIRGEAGMERWAGLGVIANNLPALARAGPRVHRDFREFRATGNSRRAGTAPISHWPPRRHASAALHFAPGSSQ